MRRIPDDLKTTLVILALTAGAVVAAEGVSRLRGPDYPDEWDPRVAGLVDSVEELTERSFEHPVEVTFQTDDEFEADVRTDETDLSAQDKAAIESSEAQGRALGLITGATDLFAEQNDLRGSGILAYYSFEDKKIVIRLPEGDTDADVTTQDDIPLDIQVTIVHEMTHALQDQLYDLGQLQSSAADDTASSAVLALIEGHAVWVERRYVESLPDNDQVEYRDLTSASLDDFEEETADVSPILSASQSAPYVTGPGLVAGLYAADGADGIDQAFTERPPVAEDQILQPVKYLDDDQPEEIPVPPAPSGTSEYESGVLGPTTLYFALSTVIDPHDALRVVGGWGFDRYVAYTRDDRTCLDVRVIGDDRDATHLLGDALDLWVQARPAAADASIETGAVIEFTVCDPGEDAPQDTPGEAAINQLFGRSQDFAFVVAESDDPGAAACLIDGLYTRFPVSALAREELPPRVSAALQELRASCR